MSYKKAEQILPMELIELIQEYVDGESIYIPRKESSRREWGEQTSIREELKERNLNIYYEYKEGYNISRLAEKYYLSEKSIQRIVRQMKNAA